MDSPGLDQTGHGLLGMTQRLDLLNGSLEIKSRPQKGTKIIIRVPHVKKGAEGAAIRFGLYWQRIKECCYMRWQLCLI